ncbi:MAG: DUF2889 domain-containing protein [Pseudomonas sp.]|uniref:DUF2889 domain-containing protein n=1 Tax=Pseudomonas sp. TaxID=306 RepID=UPI002FC9F178
MTLSIPGQAKRRLLHTRQVICTGFERDDGMFDIEGRLLDTKAVDTDFPYGTVQANGVLHYMRVTMTVDRGLVIRKIYAVSEQAPTPVCDQINRAYSALVGISIGPGFRKRVAERVGGVKGCTHLTELLGPMATTAVQTMAPLMRMQQRQRAAQDPAYQLPGHWVIGTCHAYHPDGDAARRANEWQPIEDAVPAP